MDINCQLGEPLDYKNKDSIFIGGATNFWPYYWAEIPTWYFVIQTDSLLNIRWERFIGGDAHLMVEKLIATNDGGCLLAASRYDYLHSNEPQTDIQIIKLNENGQLVNQDENILVKSTEAIIYPNPGIHSLNIRLARQYKEFSFELYSISGKLVLSETYKSIQENINAINLKAGTYIYRIYNKKGLFESGKWIKKE
ncbi:MAG: T9SS type A sorting domain-containing protein [Bacteroidota bacterium]|nr:T9SS type A sorting domain-containing protein [Bacteroidota bacterium]